MGMGSSELALSSDFDLKALGAIIGGTTIVYKKPDTSLQGWPILQSSEDLFFGKVAFTLPLDHVLISWPFRAIIRGGNDNSL